LKSNRLQIIRQFIIINHKKPNNLAAINSKFLQVVEELRKHIKQKGLFKFDEKILLAVSGGVDSMAMFYLFREAGFHFGVAHCNFKLRSRESDSDEQLVEETAMKMGVPFFKKSFPTREYAHNHGVSIQMAARELRYQWFEEIRSQNNYDYIATAHHRDDHTETVFINITRGSGLGGLRGIPLKNGKIIRPIACFSRQQLNEYVYRNKILYREDTSNADDKYLRNRIRHHVIPLLKQINPSLDRAIEELSGSVLQAYELADYLIKKEVRPNIRFIGERLEVPVNSIINTPGQMIILSEILKPFNFQLPVVQDILDALQSQPGKLFYSSTHVCLKDRHFLIIHPIPETDRSSIYYVEQGLEKVDLPSGQMQFFQYTAENIPDFPDDNNTAFLDLEKLQFPLEIRNPRDGDHFIPLGMSGKKKISDFLTDLKIPRTQKDKVWLLVSHETIVWVAGYRIHDHYKIKKAGRTILEVHYKPHKG
jgi:tRNA(Ile)-lysidine synthase